MILFDLSRLVSRAGRETPTGIDRVELAYAEHLVAGRTPLSFTMMTPLGGFGMLPAAVAKEYLQVLAGVWREAGSSQRIRRAKRLARTLHTAALWRGERALRGQCRAETGRVVYMLVSHHHLEKRRAIARLKRQVRARFVCLIHDLIPIEFPEYALPGQNDKHRRRIETAAALADAVIVNSTVTREGFAPYLARAGRAPPVVVAPFGVEFAGRDAGRAATREGALFRVRRDHRGAQEPSAAAQSVAPAGGRAGRCRPRLVLIGQRGWETENAIDMLERCPALRGVVFERANVPDDEAARLVQGARALLLPSFAEGFGFPLVEALALGVPVLCSNLAALRENGGDVPEYLDPLDGLGWRSAVIDYALPASPRRAAQLRRLSGWSAPSWQDHFAAVEALIAETRSIGQYETESPPAPGLGARREPRFNARQTADMR